MDQASRRFPALLAGLSMTTWLGAVFAASCCVLPVVLGSLGAGASVFGLLEVLADYRTVLLIASAALVAVAWLVYIRRRGTHSTALVLVLASALVVTAASWNWIEPPLLKIVRASH